MKNKIINLLSCGVMVLSMVGCGRSKIDLNTRMSIDETNISTITKNQDDYLYQKVFIYGTVDYVDDENEYVYIDVEENQEKESGAFVIIKKDMYYYEGEEIEFTGRIIDFMNGTHKVIADDGEVTYQENVIYPMIEKIED